MKVCYSVLFSSFKTDKLDDLERIFRAGIHGPKPVGPGPDQNREKIQILGPARIRTKKNFETWDRTGPEPKKISKPWTGPNHDHQNFENFEPIRT